VDPDGMRVNLFGSCIQLAINGLNKFTKLDLYNNGGVLDRHNKGEGSTIIDKILIKMIESPSLVFDIYCGDSDDITKLIPNSKIKKSDAGSFLGDEVTCNDKGEVSNVKATQYINVMKANQYDSDLQRTIGSMVLHEFVEAFCGAMISQLNGESTVTDGSSENPVYKAAHYMANSIMCGTTKPIEKEVVSYRLGRKNYPPYTYTVQTVITNVYDGIQTACGNGNYSTKIPKSFYK
jgi:hypothetical protein